MNKLEVFKTFSGVIVSVAVGTIVGNAIKSTTPADIGTVKKVLVAVGSLVLTSIVGDIASEYAEGKIDKVTEKVKEMATNGDLD